MKFLVDAQLPRRLARGLRSLGYDTLHTLDLPLGNRTPDTTINDLSIQEQRVVVTKDADFVNSFLLLHRPHKLLLISTGNITNAELETLLLNNIPTITNAFVNHDFIELDRQLVIIHM